MRYDAGFFLELQICSEYGIAHSVFLQWEPADRAKALAFFLEKSSRCQMCGTADWEWDEKQGGNRRAYEPVERFCPGCHIKLSAATHDPNRNTDGITVELEPTGTRASALRLLKQARRAEEAARELAEEEDDE